MVDQDVVAEKVASLLRCIQRIRDVTRGDPNSVLDLDIQDVVVLNLQRASQQSIDLATHVIADLKLGLPATLKENFILLRDAKIIDADLAEKLSHMVGFRNVAVHNYRAINAQVIRAIITKHLGDFEDFCDRIVALV